MGDLSKERYKKMTADYEAEQERLKLEIEVTEEWLETQETMSADVDAFVALTQKYVDGLPLARQEKIWVREGISLSRATMANWVIRCSQSWLKPLYKHMKQELLTHSVIHADETVVQVLKEDGKPATSESRMWLYASAALIRHQVRIFEYQPDRSGKRPEAFLKDFTGALVTDDYQGYNLLTKVTHCGCWAHARRKWREAMPEGATVKTSKAAVGFQYCNKLFAEERKCADYKPKYR